MRVVLVAALSLSLSSCPRPTAAAVPFDCGLAIDNVGEVLRPGGTIALGEMHGTRELPRFAGVVACEAARRGPVVFGLEIPADPSLEVFLHSDGGAEAKAALLAAPFWREDYQDGRRSVAMYELLEQTRRWRGAGLPIELLAFDGVAHDAVTRDRVMADHVLQRRQERPNATFVLLMGNLHARKTHGTPWGDTAYEPLSSMLSSRVVTLDARAPRGSAWFCRTLQPEHCGPQSFAGNAGATARAGIDLTSNQGGAYDGRFDVAGLTASPPAALPERALGLEARIVELVDGPPPAYLAAVDASKRTDFAACERELSKLADPTADQLYLRARCLARAGRIEDAAVALKAAQAKGFFHPQRLQHEDDLASLREGPR